MKNYFRIMFEKQDDGVGEEPNKDEEEEEVKPTEEESNEPKTFTQEEVNAINAKTKNKTRLAILKELGYDSEEAYIKAKEEKEKKKPLEEKLKTKESEASEAITRAEKAELKVEALTQGIPANKLDRAMKLANTYDGETPKERLEAMLKDYPEFKSDKIKDFGTGSEGNGKTELEKLEEAFERGMNG